MFKRIASIFGAKPTASTVKPTANGASPYPNEAINKIYNLLFCDQSEMFEPRPGESPNEWQGLLFGTGRDFSAVLALANDETKESRIRALAFNWLRARGQVVPNKVLLGVVVEVPLQDGLDALAAYADGQVRYINHSGKLAVFDGGPPNIVEKAISVVRAGQAIVDRIGPWDKARLPAPKQGNIRMTFVVSDGLYFGEGPFQLMQKDPLAAQFIAQAVELLQLTVNTALPK